jgi:hypothetical protein
MPMNLRTLKSVIAYADSKDVMVEKCKGKYEAWRKDDCSVVAESDTLLGILVDIDDLAEKS